MLYDVHALLRKGNYMWEVNELVKQSGKLFFCRWYEYHSEMKTTFCQTSGVNGGGIFGFFFSLPPVLPPISFKHAGGHTGSNRKITTTCEMCRNARWRAFFFPFTSLERTILSIAWPARLLIKICEHTACRNERVVTMAGGGWLPYKHRCSKHRQR